MDYQIALSPELGLSPQDFITGWNETPECRALAHADLGESTSAQYDPLLAGAAVAVLGSLALNVVSNALYDLIKKVLAKKGVQQRTEIIQLDQPDGTRLLIVRIVGE